MATGTVSNQILRADGSPDQGAQVTITLHPPGIAVFGAARQEIAPSLAPAVDLTGTWTVTLEQTATMSPLGMAYKVFERTSTGERITSYFTLDQAGPVQLSQIAQRTAPPAPSLALTKITSSDGSVTVGNPTGPIVDLTGAGTVKSLSSTDGSIAVTDTGSGNRNLAVVPGASSLTGLASDDGSVTITTPSPGVRNLRVTAGGGGSAALSYINFGGATYLPDRTGVTDCHGPLYQALTDMRVSPAQKLYLPHGDYRLTPGLASWGADASRLVFEGDGPGQSVLRFDDVDWPSNHSAAYWGNFPTATGATLAAPASVNDLSLTLGAGQGVLFAAGQFIQLRDVADDQAGNYNGRQIVQIRAIDPSNPDKLWLEEPLYLAFPAASPIWRRSTWAQHLTFRGLTFRVGADGLFGSSLQQLMQVNGYLFVDFEWCEFAGATSEMVRTEDCYRVRFDHCRYADCDSNQESGGLFIRNSTHAEVSYPELSRTRYGIAFYKSPKCRLSHLSAASNRYNYTDDPANYQNNTYKIGGRTAKWEEGSSFGEGEDLSTSGFIQPIFIADSDHVSLRGVKIHATGHALYDGAHPAQNDVEGPYQYACTGVLVGTHDVSQNPAAGAGSHYFSLTDAEIWHTAGTAVHIGPNSPTTENFDARLENIFVVGAGGPALVLNSCRNRVRGLTADGVNQSGQSAYAGAIAFGSGSNASRITNNDLDDLIFRNLGTVVAYDASAPSGQRFGPNIDLGGALQLYHRGTDVVATNADRYARQSGATAVLAATNGALVRTLTAAGVPIALLRITATGPVTGLVLQNSLGSGLTPSDQADIWLTNESAFTLAFGSGSASSLLDAANITIAPLRALHLVYSRFLGRWVVSG
jgi:hypothetical protein